MAGPTIVLNDENLQTNISSLIRESGGINASWLLDRKHSVNDLNPAYAQVTDRMMQKYAATPVGMTHYSGTDGYGALTPGTRAAVDIDIMKNKGDKWNPTPKEVNAERDAVARNPERLRAAITGGYDDMHNEVRAEVNKNFQDKANALLEPKGTGKSMSDGTNFAEGQYNSEPQMMEMFRARVNSVDATVAFGNKYGMGRAYNITPEANSSFISLSASQQALVDWKIGQSSKFTGGGVNESSAEKNFNWGPAINRQRDNFLRDHTKDGKLDLSGVQAEFDKAAQDVKKAEEARTKKMDGEIRKPGKKGAEYDAQPKDTLMASHPAQGYDPKTSNFAQVVKNLDQGRA